MTQTPTDSGASHEPMPAAGPGQHHDIADEARRTADDLGSAGLDLMAEARYSAMSYAEERKSAGADQLDMFARAIDHSASDLGEESPEIARYIHEAAGSLGRASRMLRERSVGELADSAAQFARQQPAVFFGGAVLAGLVLTRFLKSSPTNETARRPGDGDARAAAGDHRMTHDADWPENIQGGGYAQH